MSPSPVKYGGYLHTFVSWGTTLNESDSDYSWIGTKRFRVEGWSNDPVEFQMSNTWDTPNFEEFSRCVRLILPISESLKR